MEGTVMTVPFSLIPQTATGGAHPAMTLSHNHPVTRSDYTPPDYRVETVQLTVELHDDITVVSADLAVVANHDRTGGYRPLVLDGRSLVMRSISLDGRELTAGEYLRDDESLTIPHVPERCTVSVTTVLKPQENTLLEGLYRSGGTFCTQCEAEGFRRITYFPDRPDVLAVYTVTITADRVTCPVLLANGNLVACGELDDGRHYATWHDPFPKPSYLFALVAGNLVKTEQSFVTKSGRQVALQVYVQPHNRDKCDHALRSLAEAMRWDEDVFGREYDLDLYMIVAVDDFNFGAMENKGLNVFNSRYVLARPDTATDADYAAIEEVIGHEYFHNWSGNRVTCRDWFQLSVKEGLTIFRDQEFSAAMGSPAVKRIQDVRYLRTHQFPEDAGPLAHPVRPDSYEAINNLYTATVYHKGAELIRMLQAIVGHDAFRRGMDLYFDRHDGTGATVEDLVNALAEVSGRDLRQFMAWYREAGTPEVTVSGIHDPGEKTYTLTVSQTVAGGETLLIPFAMGLLDRSGRELPLRLDSEQSPTGTCRVLELDRQVQSFRFEDIPEEPVPSLLRGFSAPVRLRYDYADPELALLMGKDGDFFNRWEAGQRLMTRTIMQLVADRRAGRELRLPPALAEAFVTLLTADGEDQAFLSEALTLPSENLLGEQMDQVDVEGIFEARRFVRAALARHTRRELLAAWERCRPTGPYRFEPAETGRRSLAACCLGYLMTLDDPSIRQACLRQFRESDNMTESLSALTLLAHTEGSEGETALAEFHARWHGESLVIDKWFAIQATSPLQGTLDRVRRLLEHQDFTLANPNRARALILSFAVNNPARFHDPAGEGYRLLADHVIRLNSLNPVIGARMAEPLTRWRRHEPNRRERMRAELERISREPHLARDIRDLVTKGLTEA